MRTFMFLALRAPELTARLVRAASRTRATVVLDLEDALWDPTDQARTTELKAAGRASLSALADEHPRLFRRQPVGVRINRILDAEGLRDLEALEAVTGRVPLACVMVPKVESTNEVATAAARIAQLGLPPEALIPIVETRAGLADLDAILATARAACVEWLVFGLYDFVLDTAWWPLPDHEGDELWAIVGPLVERVENAGLKYVDPPYARLEDDAGLSRILHRLTRTCRGEFGALTVGLRQAAAANRFATGGALATLPGETTAQRSDPLDLARRVVDVYNARSRTDTSFTLDRPSGLFISPHAYVVARRYLEVHGG